MTQKRNFLYIYQYVSFKSMNKYDLSLEPSLVWSISTLAYPFRQNNKRVADFILHFSVHM